MQFNGLSISFHMLPTGVCCKNIQALIIKSQMTTFFNAFTFKLVYRKEINNLFKIIYFKGLVNLSTAVDAIHQLYKKWQSEIGRFVYSH